jgi:hypothetical protein
MHEAESTAQQMANRAAESVANSLTSLCVYVHCGEELGMWKKEAAETKGEESTAVSGGDEGGFEIIGLAAQFVKEQLGLDAILATGPALQHSMLDGVEAWAAIDSRADAPEPRASRQGAMGGRTKYFLARSSKAGDPRARSRTPPTSAPFAKKVGSRT